MRGKRSSRASSDHGDPAPGKEKARDGSSDRFRPTGHRWYLLGAFWGLFGGLLGAAWEVFVTTPIRAIRIKCVACQDGSPKAVRECSKGPSSSLPCPLFPFRLGKNPARSGIGRAMSSEDARLCRKGTSQLVTFEEKNLRVGVGGTGSRPINDPRASGSVLPKSPPVAPAPARPISPDGLMAEAILWPYRGGR